MKIEEAAMRWPDLMDYWIAPGNQGPHAGDWANKPHRLLYNLICEVADARQRAEDAEIRAHNAQHLADLRLEQIETLQADLNAAWNAAITPARVLGVSLAEVIATLKHERNEARTITFALRNKMAKARALLEETEEKP